MQTIVSGIMLGIIYGFIGFSTIVILLVGVFFSLSKLASKKHIKSPKKVYIIISFVSMLVSTAAFVLNIGWCRVILIWSLITPIHSLAFILTSVYAADFASESKKLRIYTIISYITHPLSYMLLPDGGDIGGAYMFFSLIKNEKIIDISSIFVLPCCIISIIFIILQFFEAKRLKKLARTKYTQLPIKR